jgi:hypothetical protein
LGPHVIRLAENRLNLIRGHPLAYLCKLLGKSPSGMPFDPSGGLSGRPDTVSAGGAGTPAARYEY